MITRIEDNDFFLKKSNKNISTTNANVLITNSSIGSPGPAWSLEELLSGGTYSATNVDKTSVELNLDYSVARNLAYFGSVYSRISAAINKIKDNYPTTISTTAPITRTTHGTVTITNDMFANPGNWVFGNNNQYIGYGFASRSGSTVKYYTILGVSADTTYVQLQLSANVPASTEYYIYPLDTKVYDFYNTLDSYEKELLIPTTNRTNVWPRNAYISNILDITSAAYLNFAETELSFGLDSDNGGTTNILWGKLFPDGLKGFDNDYGALQRLVLSFARSFDEIKSYQDQLVYMHSINYSDFDIIPKKLINKLAAQWNWILAYDTFGTDYSQQILNTESHYINSYNMSVDDINFGKWKRFLTNLVWIYKAKGTKYALKFIIDMFSIPEDLLDILELVQYTIDSKPYLAETKSNITIPDLNNGVVRYIVPGSTGIVSSYTYYATNTKYLDISIDPARAILKDYWSWGREYQQDFVGVGFNVFSFSGNQDIDMLDWLRLVDNATIPSDGTSDQIATYPLLKKLENVYNYSSTNKYTTAKFEPFISFIDANFEEIARQVIPASSKIIGIGRMYANTIFNRPKHIWPVKHVVDLPINKDITFTVATLLGTELKKSTVSIKSDNLVGKKQSQPTVVIANKHLVASSQSNLTSKQQLETTIGSISVLPTTNSNLLLCNEITYLPQIFNSATTSIILSGYSNYISAPIIYPYSGSYGTSAFSEFISGALITSTDYRFTSYFSASNLSLCGVTRLDFNLFRKLNAAEEQTILNSRYTILKIVSETPEIGIYRITPNYGLVMGDDIEIFYDEEEKYSTIVKITDVQQADTHCVIRTSPSALLKTSNRTSRIQFRKLPLYFDWSKPIQTIGYDNSYSGNFGFKILRSPQWGTNDHAMTGTVTFGGLDELYSNILKDKSEYFLNYVAQTEIPSGWSLTELQTYSGVNVLHSKDNKTTINGIDYYGNYFVYIRTPNVAQIEDAPENLTTGVTVAPLIKFKGVGDADILKLQFLNIGTNAILSANGAYSAYTNIPSSHWDTASTISNATLLVGANDSTIYGNKTNLNPNSWYQWRILNGKNKLTMFGYNLETYSATEPLLFRTAEFYSTTINQGEIPTTESPPTSRKVGKTVSE